MSDSEIKSANGTTTTPSDTQATSVTVPAAAPVTLREDLIKPAVSFLSSPNVKSADKSKKVAFLQNKGLNEAEIEEAFKRASIEPTHTTVLSPPTHTTVLSSPTPQNTVIPPNRQPHIVYYPPPPPPSMPAEKLFAMAVLFGMGAVGVTASVVGIIKRMVAPLLNQIAEYQRTRYHQRQEIANKLLKSLKSHQYENDDLDAVIDQGDEKTVVDAWVKHQEALAGKLDQLVSKSRELLSPRTMDLQYITDFKESLSPVSLESSALVGFKSEIRSLKAIMLNKRNF